MHQYREGPFPQVHSLLPNGRAERLLYAPGILDPLPTDRALQSFNVQLAE